jgi:hypothetical protein
MVQTYGPLSFRHRLTGEYCSLVGFSWSSGHIVIEPRPSEPYEAHLGFGKIRFAELAVNPASEIRTDGSHRRRNAALNPSGSARDPSERSQLALQKKHGHITRIIRMAFKEPV